MHSPILFVQRSSVHAFIGVPGRLQTPACCIRKLYVKVVVAVAVLYGKVVVVVLYCSTVRYVQVVVVLKVKFKMQDKEHGCYMYNARYKHLQYIYSLQKPTAFLEKFD
jgi:hypothetical protein